MLAFYWRLFSGNRRAIQVIIWVLAAVVMAWGIAVVGVRPSNQRDVSVGRCSLLSDNRLDSCHSTSMCSCLLTLGV